MKPHKKNELPATDATGISRYLSYVLRHAPQSIGLQLDPEGWAHVDELIAGAARQGHHLDRATLETVCATNDKQRFAFDQSRTRIRANQGHSVEIDLQLAPLTPPDALYHGTSERTLPAILDAGLRKMARHHVHLSPDEETARRVGARRGQPIILTVDAAGLHTADGVFYESGNGVWLVDAVPPQFLAELQH